ncbi:hypothetical protein OSB04_001253 [Centaurea solstitialis]|uniref:Uncharacterized protein n=1 Tax=Centaurea solstitialis TaxID=347529 RepID=A0AA38U8W6_9ASTR|nr:hypothetical protein OSB04_001253 [Centaurea solstitialis]
MVFSKFCRIFKHYLILLLVNQMSSGLFRFIDALGRNMIAAITLGSLHFLMVFALGGFILAQAFGKARANVSTQNEDDVELSAVEKESTDEGGQNKKKGMILPFAPHSITFNDVKYSVDMPQRIDAIHGRVEIIKEGDPVKAVFIDRMSG